MKKFKTICHNNQYRDCEITPEQQFKERGRFLLADSRPTSSGTLMQFTMSGIGEASGKTPIEVGKEYDVLYRTDQVIGYYLLAIDTNNPIYLITEDGMMVTLLDEESIHGIRFTDFFYTEAQLRDNKLNTILNDL
jgi:hypothetical protein